MSRRWEWEQQVLLASLLDRWLPDDAFFSATDGVARSPMSGWLRKKRGCKSGLPDMLIWCRRTKTIGIEMKSPGGRCTAPQRAVRELLLQAGCRWFECRSAAAAMVAIAASGLRFRTIVHPDGTVERWKRPRLAKWEKPRSDPSEPRPQHPEVAAQRRVARRRSLERKREKETANLAAERDDAEGGDIAA
jgi:hypothetical protein